MKRACLTSSIGDLEVAIQKLVYLALILTDTSESIVSVGQNGVAACISPLDLSEKAF